MFSVNIILLISQGDEDDFNDSDSEDANYRGFFKCNLDRDILRLPDYDACSSSSPDSQLSLPLVSSSSDNAAVLVSSSQQRLHDMCAAAAEPRGLLSPSSTSLANETLVKSDSCKSLFTHHHHHHHHHSGSTTTRLAADDLVSTIDSHHQPDVESMDDDDDDKNRRYAVNNTKCNKKKNKRKHMRQQSKKENSSGGSGDVNSSSVSALNDISTPIKSNLQHGDQNENNIQCILLF